MKPRSAGHLHVGGYMPRMDFSDIQEPETTKDRILHPIKLAWGVVEIVGWLAIICYPAYLAGLWLFQSAASGSWGVFLGVAGAAIAVFLWLAIASQHVRLVLIFGVLPIVVAILSPLVTRWVQ